MNRTILFLSIAALLWFVMFSPWTAPLINFWSSMSLSAVILCILSFYVGKVRLTLREFGLKALLLGIASATALWGIFWIGNYLSTRWFGFAHTQVGEIYAMKEGHNLRLVALLLLFLIGPAEEIFWRGYIQNRIMQLIRSHRSRFSSLTVTLISVALTSTVYSLVHIWSFNFMLIMASLVCGIFWGLLYAFGRSLAATIISHALWDVAVFILFPIH